MIDSSAILLLTIPCLTLVFAIIFFFASLHVEKVAEFFDNINKAKYGEIDRPIFSYFLRSMSVVISIGGFAFSLAIYLLFINMPILAITVAVLFFFLPPTVAGLLLFKRVIDRNDRGT